MSCAKLKHKTLMGFMKRIWILLLLLTILVEVQPQARAQSELRYLYSVVTEEPRAIILKAINPHNPSTAEELLTLTIPEPMGVGSVSISPDDEWLAITLRQLGSPTVAFVRLVNIQTAETRDLNQVGVAFFDVSDMFAPKVDTVWSPDGRYVAFLSVEAIASLHLLMPNIYDVQSGQFVHLEITGDDRARITWSRDSTKIALLNESCLQFRCDYSIDIYSIVDGTRVNTIPLPWQGSERGGQEVCRMDWSPDARYISFISSCFERSVEVIREVYIADLTQRTITQITNFTTDLTPPPGSSFVGRIALFDTVWVDAQTLLVGGMHRREGSETEAVNQTFAYSLATNQMTTLNLQMDRYWAVNAISGEIAYEAATFQALSPMPESANMQIATFNGSTLSTVTSYAMTGCGLSWSFDGDYLAYIEDCRNSIGFIHRSTGLTQIHSLVYGTDVASGSAITHLGWVEN